MYMLYRYMIYNQIIYIYIYIYIKVAVFIFATYLHCTLSLVCWLPSTNMDWLWSSGSTGNVVGTSADSGWTTSWYPKNKSLWANTFIPQTQIQPKMKSNEFKIDIPYPLLGYHMFVTLRCWKFGHGNLRWRRCSCFNLRTMNFERINCMSHVQTCTSDWKMRNLVIGKFNLTYLMIPLRSRNNVMSKT